MTAHVHLMAHGLTTRTGMFRKGCRVVWADGRSGLVLRRRHTRCFVEWDLGGESVVHMREMRREAYAPPHRIDCICRDCGGLSMGSVG